MSSTKEKDKKREKIKFHMYLEELMYHILLFLAVAIQEPCMPLLTKQNKDPVMIHSFFTKYAPQVTY